MSQPRSKNQSASRGKTAWWPIGAAVVIALIVVGIGLWLVGIGSAPPGQTDTVQTVPASTSEPRLAVDRDSIDVGDQPFDRLVSAVFEVRNVGGSTLNILGDPVVELVEGC